MYHNQSKPLFKVGDWVNIAQSYRDLKGTDKHAYYGQVQARGASKSSANHIYRVHCNNDRIHYFFESELSAVVTNRR